MITFICGLLIGGLGVGLHYSRKLSQMGSVMLDKHVIIDILKEYLQTQDKAKTKASRKKGVEEKG
jgi:hypothetical protein